MESSDIPCEFLPFRTREASIDRDVGLSSLFDDDEQDPAEESSSLESVAIAGHHFRVRLPPDKSTLFAHRVWSGSKLLADFVASNPAGYAEDKRTIELGAGTGLPSLVALACQSRLSILTDYPDDDILQAIRETVGLSWKACHNPLNRVAVVGHKWGTNTKNIEEAARQLQEESGLNNGNAIYFDTVLLSECLWMHRCHQDLAKSLDRLLHPDRGFALVTYAHHVPGCEAADNAFFDVCNDYRLETIHQESREMEYMWTAGRTVEIHLRVLSRRATRCS